MNQDIITKLAVLEANLIGLAETFSALGEVSALKLEDAARTLEAVIEQLERDPPTTGNSADQLVWRFRSSPSFPTGSGGNF